MILFFIHPGWTTDDSPDEVDMKAIGDEMSDVVFAVHEKRYTSQKKYQLYATSGTASDWYACVCVCVIETVSMNIPIIHLAG